jgi:hypothetical protein
LRSTQRQVDQVRNNVVVRKIEMIFKKAIQDLNREELDEFEKIYIIVDKDLELRREREAGVEHKESAEKVWEKKGLGEVKKVIDTTSLLSFLNESNKLKRLEM